MPDELTKRIRSLEAERLRPTPPAPWRSTAHSAAEQLACLAVLYADDHDAPARLSRLRDAMHDPHLDQCAESPGPRDPTEPTRKDD